MQNYFGPRSEYVQQDMVIKLNYEKLDFGCPG